MFGKMSVKSTVKAWLVPSEFNRSKFQKHSQYEESFTVWQILTCGLHQGLSKHRDAISQPDHKSAIVLSEPYRHWQQETLIGNIWTGYEQNLPTHRKRNIIQLEAWCVCSVECVLLMNEKSFNTTILITPIAPSSNCHHLQFGRPVVLSKLLLHSSCPSYCQLGFCLKTASDTETGGMCLPSTLVIQIQSDSSINPETVWKHHTSTCSNI